MQTSLRGLCTLPSLQMAIHEAPSTPLQQALMHTMPSLHGLALCPNRIALLSFPCDCHLHTSEPTTLPHFHHLLPTLRLETPSIPAGASGYLLAPQDAVGQGH